MDLAGSERLDKARLGAGPEAHRRLQEAQFINKSLASLGDCIHALASRAPHVPFRNSKLTYLLQARGRPARQHPAVLVAVLVTASMSPSAPTESLAAIHLASRIDRTPSTAHLRMCAVCYSPPY